MVETALWMVEIKCLKFAEEKVWIFDDNAKIMYHARKSLLINEGRTQMKKDGLLDVRMRAYDGTEGYELVEIIAIG